MESTLLTVAICTYKRYDLLAKALISLTQQTLSKNRIEILVVDNSPDPVASATHSAQYLQIENLRWIYESIAGLSNARNVASRHANSEIIAYLDDDAIASSHWAQSIVSTFADFGENCHVVGGRVRPIWGAPRPSWLADELLGYLSVVDLGQESRFLEHGEWVAGVNIAFRTSALRAAGGFDLSLGRVGAGNILMSNEELVLTQKIKVAGGRVAYDAGATVDHLVDVTRISQTWFRRRVAWQAVSDCVGASIAIDASNFEQKWESIKNYFDRCAPADRTIRALALHREDEVEFRQQLDTIYNLVVLFMSGLTEPANGPVPSTSSR